MAAKENKEQGTWDWITFFDPHAHTLKKEDDMTSIRDNILEVNVNSIIINMVYFLW